MVVGGKGVEKDKLSETLRRLGRDPFDEATKQLRAELPATPKWPVDRGIRSIPITVTTPQGAKGLAADFVFITYFDDEYFVKDKDKSHISDHDICSFLVAMTRARLGVHFISTKGDKKPTFLNWINPTRIREVPCPKPRGKR